MDEPRCPGCGETRQVERVIQPRWTKVVMFYCAVCSKTWIQHAEVQ